MAYCIPQATQTFLTEHIAGNPDDEEFVAAFAEDHFRRNTSVGTSQNSGKRSLRGRPSVANTPAKGLRIKVDDPRFLVAVVGIGHFSEVAIALHQQFASLFRGLRHLVRSRLRRVEAIDEFEHSVVMLTALHSALARYAEHRSSLLDESYDAHALRDSRNPRLEAFCMQQIAHVTVNLSQCERRSRVGHLCV